MATLFSKERERIIEFALRDPDRVIKIREMARQLKLSPAYVSRTLKSLKKYHLFRNNKVDLSNPYTRTLKIFFNTTKLFEKNIIKKLRQWGVAGAGIYGSWANGTNNEESDLDIWIKVEGHLSEANVASVASNIRKSLRTNAQILVLTPDRVKKIKNEDPIFYYSLAFGSLVLFGEPIE